MTNMIKAMAVRILNNWFRILPVGCFVTDVCKVE